MLKNKASLRPRSIKSIDEKADAIDPVPDTFDLAREIGVARSIDDIDFIAVVVDSGGLSKNRDATFVFNRVVIPCADPDFFVLTESTAGLQKRIDKGCFSVVNMRNNGYISDFVIHK